VKYLQERIRLTYKPIDNSDIPYHSIADDKIPPSCKCVKISLPYERSITYKNLIKKYQGGKS